MTARTKVYSAIDTERDFQDRKWGTIENHPHEIGGWLTIMRTLLTEAEKSWTTRSNDYLALEAVRELLAVGVACCEQHGITTRSKFCEYERMRD